MIHVLLADDHAVIRDGLERLLGTEEDISVVASVADGREAVATAKGLRPDVVLLDLSMPGLGGLEAARQITADRPATRVIVLSMHSTVEHVTRALRAGATSYLAKESAGAEVVRAIRAVAAGERYVSRRIAEVMAGSRLAGVQADDTPPLDLLTPREREVLQLVVEGRSSKDIAFRLGVSPKTVDCHRSRLMRKLGVDNVAGLVRLAVRNGVTHADERASPGGHPVRAAGR